MRIFAKACLFDLDGTLADSIASVDVAWTKFCQLRGLNPKEVLKIIHGRRAVESLKLILPESDPEAENAILRSIEVEESQNVKAFPGAIEFLESLDGIPWLIVTSGTSDVAEARITSAGIKASPDRVTGEQVENGKPMPDPFLLGAKRLGMPPDQCIAFEDTRAGVLSAKTAGCIVLGFGDNLGADYHFRSWNDLKPERTADGLIVTINPPI